MEQPPSLRNSHARTGASLEFQCSSRAAAYSPASCHQQRGRAGAGSGLHGAGPPRWAHLRWWRGRCRWEQLGGLSCTRPHSGTLGTHYSSGHPPASRGKTTSSFVSEHMSIYLCPGNRERSWEPQPRERGHRGPSPPQRLRETGAGGTLCVCFSPSFIPQTQLLPPRSPQVCGETE